MKTNNTKKVNRDLKIILIMLVITLVCLISFMGINVEKKGTMQNLIPSYKLGMDLEGYRFIRVAVDQSEKSNDSEDATTTEQSETKELVNPMENRTAENYLKAKKIIMSRLKKMNIGSYVIKQDMETGDILIQIPENDLADVFVADVELDGKFEIKDTQTGETLLNNNDLSKVSVAYSQAQDGVAAFLNIKFNKQGKEKLSNVTSTYVSQDNATNEVANEADAATNNENASKTITLYMDGQEVMTTSFEKAVNDGVLQLSMAQGLTNQAEIQEYLERGNQVASRLNSDSMPLKYKVEENRFMESDITAYELAILVSAGVVAITAMSIIMVIKYKDNGLVIDVLFIGFVAVFALIIRYTNVVLTIEGIFAIVAVLILEFLANLSIVKMDKITSKNIDKLLMKNIYKYIPIFIIAVISIFSNWMPIGSFGMVIFWGVLLIIAYNALVTKLLFDTIEK